MTDRSGRTFYGWYVVMGCSLVALGTAGTQFSFGVFLQPMTEEFGWSRSTLSLAFGITFMLSGLMRPLAGYLADRYSPKLVALSGVALLGVMLLIVPSVQSLTAALRGFRGDEHRAGHGRRPDFDQGYQRLVLRPPGFDAGLAKQRRVLWSIDPGADGFFVSDSV